MQLESWVQSLPEDLLKIVSVFAENGAGIWVVGGSIRQGLSGVKPNDYDLATDIEPNQILEYFPNSIKTGVEYGTVTVLPSSPRYSLLGCPCLFIAVEEAIP